MTAATPILRPLGLGELLDQAIRLYRHNFVKFVAIIALVYVPLSIVSLLVSLPGLFTLVPQASANPDASFWAAYFAWMGGTTLVSLVSYVFVQGFGTAALARAVADSRMGIETGVISAYAKTKGRVGQILLAVALALLVNLFLFVWMIIPCVGWASGPVLLLFWMNVLWPLVIPIIVIERKSTGTAIRRAWDLARRRFWWVLGFILVLFLFTMLLVYGPAFLADSIARTLLGTRVGMLRAEQIGTIIQSITTVLSSVITIPLQLTATILMYFDLRVRTEGLDLALQTGGGEGVSMSGLLESAPAARSDSLITGREAGYFASLIVILGLLGFIIVAAFFGILSLLVGFS